MSYKIATTIKTSGLLLALFIGIVSCEKDLEDIAIDLVDNGSFSTGSSKFDIIAYSVDVDSSRVDNNDLNSQPLYLLGVNADSDFGHMKSTLISQVFMPTSSVDFGDNAVIDLVVLDIPYFSTQSDENQDAVDPITGEIINDGDGNPIQVPSFELDSVYGNKTQEFNITVNELGTYLNVLDPENPSKNKSYYSDKDYDLKDLLFSDDFKLNRNDTVLYVERKYLDDDISTIDDIDTVKASNAAPSMKFYLNKEFFKNRFLEHPNSSDFESNDNFISYFRGLYIDANGADGALINVRLSNAKMSIYYTNDVIKDEGENEDLNGNGVNGEEDVAVRTKQEVGFTFNGVKAAKYVRDYSGATIENALLNPDSISGEQKLFVQGAAGSQVIIDLLTNEELEELRANNWLINEANIIMYLDENQNGEVPNKLFLYNQNSNSTLKDFKFDVNIFGGNLEYDDNGNPERYKFRITRYFSDILSLENPENLSKLVLKNYSTTDLSSTIFLDTIVKNYNWIPKGVILKGNLPEVEDKRIQLEIYYSKGKE